MRTNSTARDKVAALEATTRAGTSLTMATCGSESSEDL
jgi:hypothetical protein